jgi:hypothetical protein
MRTATIATTIAAMMEGGGGDCAYNEDECGDGIVETDERGAAAARGDDTNCPFLRLCLHLRLVLALTLSARPFKLERLTAIQSRRIAELLP